MQTFKIDKISVSGALMGTGNELAHIELIMGREAALQKLRLASR
ncbi:Formaldehyde-activating enzyme (fragment) [Candidatus Methylobacter favarea]|uniref:Formaldehyde-activating enzyme n=1 Tax=Candidatus Methylobacter favarea TaxID=2707345 RepID=A0A8S0XVX4_9GAMM